MSAEPEHGLQVKRGAGRYGPWVFSCKCGAFRYVSHFDGAELPRQLYEKHSAQQIEPPAHQGREVT